jgi:hypothetical protein
MCSQDISTNTPNSERGDARGFFFLRFVEPQAKVSKKPKKPSRCVLENPPSLSLRYESKSTKLEAPDKLGAALTAHTEAN